MIASKWKKRLAFLAAVASMGFVWLVLLPACARQEAISQRLKWLDQQGIDPSAMYYTELEVMEDILQRHRTRQLHRKASHDE